MARPRRLDGFNYTGFATYFLTTCTLDRRKVFTSHDFCDECRDALFAISKEFGLEADAYCFMPDHVHCLIRGIRPDSAFRPFVAIWKQRTGYAWHQRSGQRFWQHGYYEHVLRSDDPILSVTRYIFENPVRAGLVDDVRAYPFLGSSRYSLDETMRAIEWLAPWRF